MLYLAANPGRNLRERAETNVSHISCWEGRDVVDIPKKCSHHQNRRNQSVCSYENTPISTSTSYSERGRVWGVTYSLQTSGEKSVKLMVLTLVEAFTGPTFLLGASGFLRMKLM